MKKIVLKLELHDDKAKQKAFKQVSTLSVKLKIEVFGNIHMYVGIDSIAMDMKERKMTVIGTVDPIRVVSKLRKHWPSTTIILVEAAKEPEKEKKEGVEKKEEEPKKGEENALEEAKKDDEVKKKGEEPKRGEEAKNKEEEDEDEDEEKIKPIDPYMLELVKANHRAYYNNHNLSTYYYAQSMEENPNTCVIC